VLIRSRSARFAALALAVTTPLVAATTLPAFAAGESATAELASPTSGTATTFTWNYTFHQNGGNDLSNIAIGFCSADILEDVESASAGDAPVDFFLSGDVQGGHDGFGPGIKFHTPADSGTITVTFKNPHPIAEDALRIQSHSGGGQTSDATTTADGPGVCPVDPTDDGDGDDDGTNDDGTNDDGTNDDGTNDDGTNDAGTDVLGTVVENNDGGGTQTTASPADPAVTIAAQPTNVPTVSPTPTPTVSGNDLTAGAQLPRTGASVQFLLTLAFSLVLAGLALRTASSRRIRSASSPG
jgi:hypothetical protein